MNLVPAIDTARHRDLVLERLLALHPKSIDLSLDRVRRLLSALGDPHRDLPPVVHVSGTNGKGSVLAFLRAMLTAAGYRVHVYTSPHLVRFNERIVLAGEVIDDGELLARLDETERANNGAPITFFEITTAAAMLAFARHPADVVLLETGLGGRLDATNVIAAPALTAVTPISLDHQQFLGETLGQIAAEKAGILKPGVPAVVGPQAPEVLALIDDRAALLGAPVAAHGREWRAAPSRDGFRYDGRDWRLTLPRPALGGHHQIANAATAIACLERLPDFTVSAAAIRTGLTRAAWPARLQSLTAGPLAAALPAGSSLWLDGGHNEAAAKALAAAFTGADGRPLDLIVGMIDSKDPRAFLNPFVALARNVRTVAIPDQQAAIPADTLAEAAVDCGLAAAPADSVAGALAALLASADGAPARILICGSLYLAGHILADHS